MATDTPANVIKDSTIMAKLERSARPPEGSSLWDRFLWDWKVEDMMGSRRYKETERLKREAMDQIIFVSKDESVAATLDTLTKNKILSVPVYDDEANMFVGFVDVVDLVAFCVKGMNRGIASAKLFSETQVGAIVNCSGRDSWVPMDRKAPLMLLFDTLSRPDVHRVPIVDNKQPNPATAVIGLITQSQVLKWIWDQREKEGFPKDIEKLKIKDFKEPVIYGKEMLGLIGQNETLIEAFRTIKRERVTGIGVVNERGELVGNVSASDIKVCFTCGKELVDVLEMKIDQFLALKSTLMIDVNRRISLPKPVTVTEEATVEEVLGKLIQHGIHRLWVVGGKQEAVDLEMAIGADTTGIGKRKRGKDETQLATSSEDIKKELTPIGCVSLCDVLNEFACFKSSEKLHPEEEEEESGYAENEEEDWDEEGSFSSE